MRKIINWLLEPFYAIDDPQKLDWELLSVMLAMLILLVIIIFALINF